MSLLCSSGLLFSQENKNLCKDFGKLSPYEKCWVMRHPFAAKKAWKISSRTIEIAKRIESDPDLDGDKAGGQVDAFRHAFWMFSLSSRLGRWRAISLGRAHEKANIRSFKKGEKENDVLPDKASMEMDLFNNSYGVLLGRQYPSISEDEMIEMVKKAVLNGDLKVIKKDKSGNSVDEDDKIISDWSGKWENRRVLVSSDYKRQERAK